MVGCWGCVGVSVGYISNLVAKSGPESSTYSFVRLRPGFPGWEPGCLPRFEPGFGPGVLLGLSEGKTVVTLFISEVTGDEASGCGGEGAVPKLES